MHGADAVPARPRPDRPFQVVPPAEGEDPGLHRPRGRPLPDADDPYARDDGDLARRRPRAAAERGSRRGDRARPRHGPHAVRPRRRAGARRGAARALRRRVPAQRAIPPDRAAAQPHARGVRRDPHAHRAAGARDARGPDRPHRRPDRVREPRHRRRGAVRAPVGERPPGRRARAARRDRLGADRHARARPGRCVHPRGRDRPGGRRGGGDALTARVHVRARLPRPAGRARARPGRHRRPRDPRRPRRPSREAPAG